MNKVYKLGSEYTEEELRKESGYSDWTLEHISGSGHCDCDGEGIFVLLPVDHPACIEGGKRYMVCINCGQSSHL